MPKQFLCNYFQTTIFNIGFKKENQRTTQWNHNFKRTYIITVYFKIKYNSIILCDDEMLSIWSFVCDNKINKFIIKLIRFFSDWIKRWNKKKWFNQFVKLSEKFYTLNNWCIHLSLFSSYFHFLHWNIWNLVRFFGLVYIH